MLLNLNTFVKISSFHLHNTKEIIKLVEIIQKLLTKLPCSFLSSSFSHFSRLKQPLWKKKVKPNLALSSWLLWFGYFRTYYIFVITTHIFNIEHFYGDIRRQLYFDSVVKIWNDSSFSRNVIKHRKFWKSARGWRRTESYRKYLRHIS